MSDVTILLRRAATDDRAAIDELFALLYDDLNRMARARLADNRPITLLDATSLAHEAYLRLRSAKRIDIESRVNFLAYVSQVLRAIIVDFARRRRSARRGGDQARISLDTELADSIGDADADARSSRSTTRSRSSTSRTRAFVGSSRCATSAE